MNIVKLAGHLTVDLLFRRAFPEMTVLDLDAGEWIPNREDWRYKVVGPKFFPIRSHVEDKLLSACAVGWSLKKELKMFAPDVFIVDDFFGLMVAKEVRAKRIVFYCHADYTSEGNPHNEFQRHALSALEAAPTIYPTQSKKEANRSWRVGHPSAVIPLGLPDESFVTPSTRRNGRACIVRQNVVDRLKLYEPEKFQPLFGEVCTRMQDTLDVYGDNGEWPDGYGSPTLKGWVSPISDLRDYSVALEPFGNRSVSMCQLELMAACVPLVTYPREEFDRKDSRAYLIAETPDEFVHQAGVATRCPEVGIEGQVHAKRCYGQARWARDVRKFVEAQK